MPESNRQSPAPFRIPPGFFEAELRTISHVTHLQNALTILQEGKIGARLVYDDSILNSTRTQVVWLSPNDWSGARGSRYGNIQFQFDWNYIVPLGTAWWIGSKDYSPTAARILITEQKPDSSLQLVHYNPSAPGPWERRSAGGDLWNDSICLEVLVECDLPLTAVTRLACVKHHDMRCRIAPGGKCSDAGFSGVRAASLLIAAVVAGNVPHRGLFPEPDGTESGILEQAWTILHKLPGRSQPEPSGTITHAAPEAAPLARAILAAYAARREDDVASLCGMFQGQTALREAIAAVIEDHLNLQRGVLK